MRLKICNLIFFVFLIFTFLIFNYSTPYAQKLGFKKITNEVSLYQNRYDDFLNAGQTFQLVCINSFRLLTWFNLEITWDLNYDLEKEDKFTHYVEVGIVKELLPHFSVNYQRIHGTFIGPWRKSSAPVNQVGIRYSF